MSNLFLCLLSPGSLTSPIDFILSKNSSACFCQFVPEVLSGEIAKINSPPLGGPPSGGEFILAISPDKTAGTNWQKHADEFFDKMKSMGEVRLPGERRHKNRQDKGPRNINEELVNKIKSLS